MDKKELHRKRKLELEFFSHNCKTFRELASFSQEELASLIGTTRSSVNNYELGLNVPSKKNLHKFSEIVNDHFGTNFMYPDFLNKEVDYE